MAHFKIVARARDLSLTASQILFSHHYPKRYSLFRRRLRDARLEAGFTQIEAARLLGITQSVLSKCERGERRVDAVELLEFARVYKKPLSYFLEEGPSSQEA